jgi:hypothetical protein
MKPQKQKVSSITLFPPTVEESVLSNKFELIVRVRWGEFDESVRQSKEEYGWQTKIFAKINEALLKASEVTQPYTIHE